MTSASVASGIKSKQLWPSHFNDTGLNPGTAELSVCCSIAVRSDPSGVNTQHVGTPQSIKGRCFDCLIYLYANISNSG